MGTLKNLLDASRLEGDVLELLEQSGGEITPEISEMLEHVAKALPAKVDKYKHWQDAMSARIDWIDKEIASLQSAKKSINKALERSENFLYSQMKEKGLHELSGESYRFKIVACAPRTIIDNAEDVPGTYKIVEMVETIDKRKVKEAITQGESVPGARLEGGESVRCYRRLGAD